jgi:hypothetical protein
MVATHATKEALWLNKLMTDLSMGFRHHKGGARVVLFLPGFDVIVLSRL